jgi:hypothetical protein
MKRERRVACMGENKCIRGFGADTMHERDNLEDLGENRRVILKYEGNSISKLQIQGANYVFELSAGNCHR